MVSDKYRANLSDLIGFCFISVSLEIDFLFYTFFAEYMMTAPCPFLKTKPP